MRTLRVRPLILAAAAALAAVSSRPAAADKPAPEMKGLPLVADDEFQNGADRWEPTDPAAWRVDETAGVPGPGASPDSTRALALVQQSKYEPPVRSPKNISLLKDVYVGDFVLDINVRSTTRDYPHRDLCLVFGHQDPSHFYYVHLGKNADPHSNSIFLVNGEPRVSIAKTRTTGTNWTDNWHHVRIVRTAATGVIEIYFDDMEKPAMTAEDKTFAWGRIGVGSFDDTGMFDNVRLWGQKVEPGK